MITCISDKDSIRLFLKNTKDPFVKTKKKETNRKIITKAILVIFFDFRKKLKHTRTKNKERVDPRSRVLVKCIRSLSDFYLLYHIYVRTFGS